MKTIDVKNDQILGEGCDIRDMRKQLGISQEELAYAVGLEQSTVSKVELKRSTAVRTRSKLIKALRNWPPNEDQ